MVDGQCKIEAGCDISWGVCFAAGCGVLAEGEVLVAVEVIFNAPMFAVAVENGFG